MWLLALSPHGGVRTAEIAFLFLLVAGIALTIDALVPPRRTAKIVAGITLALGGFLLIVATHWGHFR
jgi:hypothetical protein